MPYADPDKHKEYQLTYRKNNADVARARVAAWRAANPSAVAAHNVKWNALRKRPPRVVQSVEDRRRKAAKYARDWRARNPEKHQEAAKLHKKKHRAAYTALQMKRKATQLRAVPPWADLKLIRGFYIRAAATGQTVDHVIPLQSPLVCGLHCEANLQLLPGKTNTAKGNRWWPDMP